jgi:tetratricopeptide (TPR) repeat protein
MNTYESEFEDALEMARALLGGNEDASDLWEANELVNHAISLRPADTDAWILKCQILSALEDDTAALAAIEMAVRRSPRRAEAHYWRAAVLGDLQRYDEALKSIERGFRHVSGDEEWLLEDLYYEKAAVLDAIGRRDEALATYEAGLRRCPDSSLLRAAIEPLRRENVRSRFTVLEGGRRR